MENSQMLPFITNRIIPEDLMFDNDEIDSSDENPHISNPSSADILNHWLTFGEVHEDCIYALAAILVRNPNNILNTHNSDSDKVLKKALSREEKAFRENNNHSLEDHIKLAQLMHINSRYDEAEAQYKEALIIAMANFGIASEVRIGILEDYIALTEISGKIDDNTGLKKQLEKEKYCFSLMKSCEKSDLINLRSIIAKDLLDEKNFKDAEEIYKWLLSKGFETPGIHNHLARLYAYLDLIEESKAHLEIAWKKRNLARKYVLPRIKFLQILFSLIERKDISKLITEFKKTIESTDAYLEWHIEALVNKFKNRLEQEDYDFLISLSCLINITPTGYESLYQINVALEKLNSYSVWSKSNIQKGH